MDMQQVITAINESACQVEGLASPLNETQLNTVPYPKSWTAAQLLRHLVKSETLMTGALETPAALASRDTTQRVAELGQIFLDPTNRLNSPDLIVPEEGHYGKAAILTEWQQALDRFDHAAAAANPAELIGDLPLGPVTKLEIAHFVLFHTQRHLIQMRKIVAAL
jgi:hypothetical protein